MVLLQIIGCVNDNTVFQSLFGDPRNIALFADFLQSVPDFPDVQILGAA